jgi:hypothetical protein
MWWLDELELLPGPRMKTDASPAPAVPGSDPRHHAQSTARSNARAEALNNKVKLIARRAYGVHSANAALALVCLTCGPVTPTLPHEQVLA